MLELELLLAATRRKHSAMVINILSFIPSELLEDFIKSVDKKNNNLIHYFAYYNQVEVLVWIKEKIPSGYFIAEADGNKPSQMALLGNAKEAFAWFWTNFPTDIVQQVYLGAVTQPGRDVMGLEYAVAVGNMPLVSTLLMHPDAASNVSIFKLLALAIKNQQRNLIPLLSRKLKATNRQRLAWLNENFSAASLEGDEILLLEYIEENYSDAYDIVKMIFIESNAEHKHGLILVATKLGCESILQGLVNEYSIDDPDRSPLVREIVTVAAVFNFNLSERLFLGRDALDVACRVCVANLNENPRLLAEILFLLVKSNLSSQIDVILCRVSNDAKLRAFSYQFKGDENVYNWEKSVRDNGNATNGDFPVLYNGINEFKGTTLGHIAVDHYSVDALMVMNAHGASFDDIKNHQMKSIKTVVKEKADAAHIYSKNLMNKKNKKGDISAQMILAIKNGDKDENLQAMINSPLIQDDYKQQLLFSQLTAKLQDSHGLQTDNLVKLLLNTLNNVNFKKFIKNKANIANIANIVKCWKILIKLVSEKIDSPACGLLYKHLTSIINEISDKPNAYQYINSAKAVPYGIVLQNYEQALKQLNIVSNAAPSLDAASLLAETSLSQIIISRLGLMFCDVCQIDLSHLTRLLTDVASLSRINISSPLVIGLQSIKSANLTVEALEGLVQNFAHFEQDYENYKDIKYSYDKDALPAIKMIAIKTKLQIKMIFDWFNKIEREIYKNGLQFENIYHHEPKKCRLFVGLKMIVLRALDKADDALNSIAGEILTPEIIGIKKELAHISQLAALLEHTNKEESQQVRFVLSPPFEWALKMNDERRVISCLEDLDVEFLSTSGRNNIKIAAYLLERLINTNNVAGFKLLLSNVSKAGIAVDYNSLLSSAISKNRKTIVDCLADMVNIHIATPYHDAAFKSSLSATTTKIKTTALDDFGVTPVGYAVSGGDNATVQMLLQDTPKEFISPGMLLIRAIESNNLHLYPILPKLTFDQLDNNIVDILNAVKASFIEPAALLEKIIMAMENDIRLATVKLIALNAVYEGMDEVVIGLLGKENLSNVFKKVELVSYLLSKIAFSYSELVAINNEGKQIFSYPLIKAQKREKKYRVNNIETSRIVTQLAYLLADISDINLLRPILLEYLNANYTNGMMELLTALSPTAAERVINYSANNMSSLLYIALHTRNYGFIYPLLAVGGKLPTDKGWTNIKLNVEEIKVANSLNSFKRVLNKIARGESIESEMAGYVRQIMNTVKSTANKQLYINHLAEAWQVVVWCSKSHLKRTDFKAIRLLIKTFLDPKTSDVNDLIRYIVLSFVTEAYDEALKFIGELEIRIKLVKELNPVTVAYFITLKAALILFTTLKISIPEHLKLCFVSEWNVMCNNHMIGEGMLSFISSVSFDSANLPLLVEKFNSANWADWSAKIQNRRENVNGGEGLALVGINSANVAIYNLLGNWEIYVKEIPNKYDIKYYELARNFYTFATDLAQCLDASSKALLYVNTAELKIEITTELKNFIHITMSKKEKYRKYFNNKLIELDKANKNKQPAKNIVNKAKSKPVDRQEIVKTSEMTNKHKNVEVHEPTNKHKNIGTPVLHAMKTYINPEDLNAILPTPAHPEEEFFIEPEKLVGTLQTPAYIEDKFPPLQQSEEFAHTNPNNIIGSKKNASIIKINPNDFPKLFSGRGSPIAKSSSLSHSSDVAPILVSGSNTIDETVLTSYREENPTHSKPSIIVRESDVPVVDANSKDILPLIRNENKAMDAMLSSPQQDEKHTPSGLNNSSQENNVAPVISIASKVFPDLGLSEYHSASAVPSPFPQYKNYTFTKRDDINQTENAVPIINLNYNDFPPLTISANNSTNTVLDTLSNHANDTHARPQLAWVKTLFDALPEAIMALMLKAGKYNDKWRLMIVGGAIFNAIANCKLGGDLDFVYYGTEVEFKNFLFEQFNKNENDDPASKEQCWTVQVANINCDFTRIQPNSEVAAYMLSAYKEYLPHIPSKSQFFKDLLINALSRNFKLKAIFLAPDGEIIDLLGGMGDIINNVISFPINDETTFLKFPVRGLQAILLRLEYGASYDECAEKAMRKFLHEVQDLVFSISLKQLIKFNDKVIKFNRTLKKNGIDPNRWLYNIGMLAPLAIVANAINKKFEINKNASRTESDSNITQAEGEKDTIQVVAKR